MFNQGKITKNKLQNYLECTLLLPVVINKTIVQQNRIKTLHHNGIRWNKSEDARTSPVAFTNRLPNSLKN